MKKEVIFTKSDLKELIEECKGLRTGESNQWYGYAIEDAIETIESMIFRKEKQKLQEPNGL